MVETTPLAPVTPLAALAPLARHGRFVGRVGGLAVALGIGIAIANGPAVATADDTTAGAQSSSSSTSENDTARTDTSRDRAADRDVDGEDVDDHPTDQHDVDDHAADASEQDAEEDDANRQNVEQDVDEDDEVAAADVPDDTESPPTRTTVAVTAAEPDGGDAADVTGDRDNSPESAAVWTLTGVARREAVPESTVAPLPTPATSPLATEQQLAAERIASETVKTWPVRLMKFVLGAGWLATATRQYDHIGGPDWDNIGQLGRSVDEYAMGAAFQQQLLNPMTPTVVTQVAPPHTWYGRDVPGSRILYDNPDTVYRFMGVNMTSTYVIRGQFVSAQPADTNFSVLTGLSGVTADYLSGRDIDIAPDGSFTITVSGAPAAAGQRNHLQLTSDTTLIAVRNTLSDWTTQSPMTLSIERLSGPRNSLFSQLGGFAIPGLGPLVTRSPLLTALVSLIPPMKEPPRILRGAFTAVIVALGLGMESKYIKVATTDPQTGERVAPNVLKDPSRNAEFLATQLQSAGYFHLADDQALVVSVTPGNARYFTVPVTNLWTITGDYWNEQTSLNNAQALPNPDGTYTFVISPTDPGVHNWVSTGGLNKGTLSLRFQDLDLNAAPTPTVDAQVVALPDLPAVLPPTTIYLSAAQRQEQLDIRRAAFDRRFAVAD
ncbi:hypothetical protein [Mycobacterium sp. ZZG]